VLIVYGSHRGAFTAEVGRKLKSCSTNGSSAFKDYFSNADIYELKFLVDMQLSDELALPASDWLAQIADGKTTLKHKNANELFSVDTCTSNEGLWVSLLQENESVRMPLYSVYRNLGYDTQPTCGTGGYEPLT